MSQERSFWLVFVGTAFITAAILFGTARMFSHVDITVPKPSFPGIGTYVSAYESGHADHYLFLFGILGFGEHIKSSDVLIVGSSHPEFGISATDLARNLSLGRARQIKAFNLGLGFAEGMPFAREILKRNDIYNKRIVVDLYSMEQERTSDFAKEVEKADCFTAYLQVFKIWAAFTHDWLLDNLVVAVRIDPATGIHFERFLKGVIYRKWDSGDVAKVWSPTSGSIYEKPGHPLLVNTPKSEQLVSDVSLSDETIRFLGEHHLQAFLILLPYPGYDENAAARTAEKAKVSFVNIGSTGLEYWDSNHLNAVGRKIATERILEKIDLSSAH